VGKSTTATQLAYGLNKKGFKVKFLEQFFNIL